MKVDEYDASEGCSTAKKAYEDLFHIEMTFDDFFWNDELLVHVTIEEVDEGKKKKGKTRGSQTVEDDDKVVIVMMVAKYFMTVIITSAKMRMT